VFAGSQAGTIVVWDIEAQKGKFIDISEIL
jgi:hypothetical protein